MTGRGVEDVKRRIMEAFEQVHLGQPAPVKTEFEETSSICRETGQKAKFERYSNALVNSAMHNPVVRHVDQQGAWEISVPTESAEELIKEALGE